MKQMMMKKTKKSPTMAWIATLSLMVSVCFGSTMGSIIRAQAHGSAAPSGAAKPKAEASYPVLSRYATDLTALARQARLEAVRGHEAEIRRVAALLSNNVERNPVLIGESNNADKMALALGLAQKIAAGDVPENLRDKRVFSLNLDRLSAGAKDPAEFASRLQAILAETTEAKGRVILFVDELHQLIGDYANPQASAALRAAL